MQVTWVPQCHLRAGTVVRASVDYREGAGHKARPVVIVSVGTHDVVALKITSQLWRLHQPGHAEIEDWQGAGLSKPSAVALHPVTLPRIDLIEVLGALSESDMPLLAHLGATARESA